MKKNYTSERFTSTLLVYWQLLELKRVSTENPLTQELGLKSQSRVFVFASAFFDSSLEFRGVRNWVYNVHSVQK